MHKKPLLWMAALALAATLGFSAQASASTFRGTVVHANKRAHTFVVANRRGRLIAFSARRVPRAGRLVVVSARRTRSGSLRASRVHVRGHRHRARMRGIVTWRSAHAFTVSSHGVSLLVNKRTATVRKADEDVRVGEPVETEVTIDDQGDLDEDNAQQVGETPTQFELEGVVLSTDPSAETITLSGDEDQEDAAAAPSESTSEDSGDTSGDEHGDTSAQPSDDGEDDQGEQPSIVVHVPDATQFTAGEKVELIVTGPAADGSFTLVKVDEVENENGEDG